MDRVHMFEMAQHIHLLLDVAGGVLELRAQARSERAPVGRRVQRAHVQKLIQQNRMERQIFGRPGTRAHELGHASERLRILLQKREISLAAAHALQ
jgi:hypothetical protein